MSNKAEVRPMTVEQVDRIEAAECFDMARQGYLDGTSSKTADAMRAGLLDDSFLVQAFARHRIAAEARSHDAEWEAMRALTDIVEHFADGDQGPGHGHTILGIWDDDGSNGEKAGKPCDWCAKWERARALVSAVPLDDGGE